MVKNLMINTYPSIASQVPSPPQVNGSQRRALKRSDDDDGHGTVKI